LHGLFSSGLGLDVGTITLRPRHGMFWQRLKHVTSSSAACIWPTHWQEIASS
jgi:hypothetical protein